MTNGSMVKKEMTDLDMMEDDRHNRFSDIFDLLTELSNFRLIEKLSRPSKNEQRLALIQQYKQKFDLLHLKLDTVVANLMKETRNLSHSKYRSDTYTVKPVKEKKLLKGLVVKYNKVFKEGSFKHYERVCKVYELKCELKALNVQHWMEGKILECRKKQEKCC